MWKEDQMEDMEKENRDVEDDKTLCRESDVNLGMEQSPD